MGGIMGIPICIAWSCICCICCICCIWCAAYCCIDSYHCLSAPASLRLIVGAAFCAPNGLGNVASGSVACMARELEPATDEGALSLTCLLVQRRTVDLVAVSMSSVVNGGSELGSSAPYTLCAKPSMASIAAAGFGGKSTKCGLCRVLGDGLSFLS